MIYAWRIPLVAMAIAGIWSSAFAADLRIAIRNEPVLDPHFMWTDANIGIYYHLYGGLTQTDEQGQVKPGLAESWSAASATEWRFVLRKGAKFSDGTEVTAQDVVDSYQRMRTVKAAASFAGVIANLQDVQAIDERTVSIVTTKPNPLVPHRVSIIQIVPSKIAKSATHEDFTARRAVIGAGPYRLVSFEPSSSMVLERNPDYWGPSSKWDKITFRFIPDDAARVAALLSRDVDMIEAVPPDLIERLRSEPGVNVIAGRSSRIFSLTIDSSRDQTPFVKGLDGQPLPKNPYKDRRVREALSLAIDRDLIAARVMNGLAYPTGQLTTASFVGYSDALTTPKPDPARAKQLLAEAGYPSGFAMTLHCTNDAYAGDARTCQAIGQMFSRIGLKVEVQTMPKAVLTSKAMDPNGERFSLTSFGWSDSSGDALVLANCVHSYDPAKGYGSYNWGRYSNPKVDTLVERAGSVLDRAERHALLSEAMKDAMDDDALIPLYQQSVVVALRKKLTYKTWLTEYVVADSVSETTP